MLYVDLTGRVLGPEGRPVRNLKIVVREKIRGRSGQPAFAAEGVSETNEEGLFRIRTTFPYVSIKTVDAELRSAHQDVDVQVKAFANKERRLEDIRLERRSGRINARFVSQGSGEAVSGEIEVAEFEGGSVDVIDLGNSASTVRVGEGGTATWGVDPDKRYRVTMAGRAIVGIDGAVAGAGAMGLLTFRPSGGDVIFTVQDAKPK